ncbi:HAD-IC family P-type ATPase [Streptosporangium sp. NPDC006007]|uniref:cation-translocating P-type ATPase n=1 Tax=Streptosporangium sp. NPDC006007 TaxID=3154575 RepID=UPI0033B175B4
MNDDGRPFPVPAPTPAAHRAGTVSTAGGRSPVGLLAGEAASLPAERVLDRLDATEAGLSSAEAGRRLAVCGPNAVRTHHARALRVLGRQLRNAVLILLAVTAVISFLLGNAADAVIIGVILAAGVGLGFANEYRAERATQALHSQVRHTVVALRDGRPTEVDVTALVPGDVVRLTLGSIVPADLRLLSATGLECDESVLTGESLPVSKTVAPAPSGADPAEPSRCALMGTVVRAGNGTGVVVATGGRAEFGRIALGLGERQPETDFQAGLRHFSVLLLQVAMVLTFLILVTNLVLRRPLVESLLFSLAIAVGITPQLLPAVVGTSLAAGSRQLARRRVLVKRLVCIEDLGDLDVLVTDKTGTLTEGRIDFVAALAPDGGEDDRVLLFGLLATEANLQAAGPGTAGGNPLDTALWRAPGAAAQPAGSYRRLGLLPFDHDRRMTTALLNGPDGTRTLVTKGAPEAVLSRCRNVPVEAAKTLRARFAEGSRVVAVATGVASGQAAPAPSDERDLTLAGFLVFLDRPKAAAAGSLRRLAELGVTVKIATGDNPLVAEKVCAGLGLVSGGTLTGGDIGELDDDALIAAAENATIFARVSPEQKARLIRLMRRRGRAVGFLGDGVNDALALHAADVGISVDSATDHVDPEQLRAPSHWDIGFIRRFMLFFGPISSLFDFLTFAIMLGFFHAGPDLFRSGWFVESLATQTLIIFAIRTRRVPFLRSRPSRPLLIAVLSVVTVGVLLPLSPLAPELGFTALPLAFFLALAGMVVAYLVLIEFAKKTFFAEAGGRLPVIRRRGHLHRVQRRASRFSHPGPLPGGPSGVHGGGHGGPGGPIAGPAPGPAPSGGAGPVVDRPEPPGQPQ